MAFLLGVWFQPSYLPLCEVLHDPFPCSPVSKLAVGSYSVIILGVISLIAAPILLSLRAEVRTEGNTRRPVWRATNYGLLVGLLYLAAGVVAYVAFG